MLEKIGVHGVMASLGGATGSGVRGLNKAESGINSTEGDFYTTTVVLPKDMALVLVLAQDSSTPVANQQTNTSRGGGGGKRKFLIGKIAKKSTFQLLKLIEV
jgi:hypothetical protein